jgi:hypothetical protein
MNNRRYFGRQDVKERTMKKSLAALDPDIASRYEDLDDEDNSTHRYRGVSLYNRLTIKKKI